jgi:hypothetical protein
MSGAAAGGGASARTGSQFEDSLASAFVRATVDFETNCSYAEFSEATALEATHVLLLGARGQELARGEVKGAKLSWNW